MSEPGTSHIEMPQKSVSEVVNPPDDHSHSLLSGAFCLLVGMAHVCRWPFFGGRWRGLGKQQLGGLGPFLWAWWAGLAMLSWLFSLPCVLLTVEGLTGQILAYPQVSPIFDVPLKIGNRKKVLEESERAMVKSLLYNGEETQRNQLN